MRTIESKIMTDKEISYFSTTRTMTRRVRTMLATLGDGVSVDECRPKLEQARERIEEALSILDTIDPYTEKANRNQLIMDFGEEN